MTMGSGKVLAQFIKLPDSHSLKEIGEHLLLYLIVGIESQLHEYQQGSITQETEQESLGTMHVTDEGKQRVLRGERPVKVKGYYLSHGMTR